MTTFILFLPIHSSFYNIYTLDDNWLILIYDLTLYLVRSSVDKSTPVRWWRANRWNRFFLRFALIYRAIVQMSRPGSTKTYTRIFNYLIFFSQKKENNIFQWNTCIVFEIGFVVLLSTHGLQLNHIYSSNFCSYYSFKTTCAARLCR